MVHSPMLKIYFLSKTKVLFQWDIFEEIVSLQDKNAILNLLNRVRVKTLYLYDIKNITADILQNILDLIDINLFGYQLETIYANNNHPIIFKKLDYDFKVFSTESSKDDECPCMDVACRSNPKDSPFIALGDCLKWDTVCKNNTYTIPDNSNVEAIQKLHNAHGDIAWSSSAHGKTVVCFKNLHQLQHALKNDLLTGWAVFLK